MALNNLSPSYLRWRYVANGHRHTMTLPIKLAPGFTPGTLPDVELHDGSFTDVDLALTSFGAVIQPFFKTTASFGLYEVWSQPLPTDEPVFVYAGVVNVVGTDTGPEVPACEQVFTFRTASKGGFKLFFMESNSAINTSFDPPYSNPVFSDLSDYVTGDNSFLYGRNNDPPIAPIRAVTKINDVLRRKYITG